MSERGFASRLSEKVDCRKSLLEKGQTEKVRWRKFTGEGPPEKWLWYHVKRKITL